MNSVGTSTPKTAARRFKRFHRSAASWTPFGLSVDTRAILPGLCPPMLDEKFVVTVQENGENFYPGMHVFHKLPQISDRLRLLRDDRRLLVYDPLEVLGCLNAVCHVVFFLIPSRKFVHIEKF
jgi:hypothetical protein